MQYDMVKDERNGAVLCRGIDCAPKIIAYTYAKRLMERGIAGQPLCWKLLKKNYACGCFSAHGYYFYNKKELRQAPGSETLWCPEDIPEDIWQKAVQCFTPRDLEENLLRYLIPLLGDVKELISYDRLLDITEHMLIENDILGWLVRRCGNDAYYFDENGLYTKGSIEEIQEDQEKQKWRRSLWFNNKFNQTIWCKAAAQFREGATLRECIDIFFQTQLFSTPLNYTYLDRLVTRIEPAEYERVPGNDNLRTFDRIRVQVNLSHTLHPDVKDLVSAVKKNRKEIDAMVLSQIGADRRFRRFGVPLNVLKLGALTLYGHTMEYIFEIKESDI